MKNTIEESLTSYHEQLEAALLQRICDILYERGRIAPGEPLLREIFTHGTGHRLYSFPDYHPRALPPAEPCADFVMVEDLPGGAVRQHVALAD